MQARGNSSTAGLTLDTCTKSVATNLTIYTSGSYGIYTSFGSNNSFM